MKKHDCVRIMRESFLSSADNIWKSESLCLGCGKKESELAALEKAEKRGFQKAVEMLRSLRARKDQRQYGRLDHEQWADWIEIHEADKK